MIVKVNMKTLKEYMNEASDDATRKRVVSKAVDDLLKMELGISKIASKYSVYKRKIVSFGVDDDIKKSYDMINKISQSIADQSKVLRRSYEDLAALLEDYHKLFYKSHQTRK